MNLKKIFLYTILISSSFFSSVLASESENNSPPLNERFEYKLTWNGIKTGTAILEIKEDNDRIIITSTALSADWISIFYKVEDIVTSNLRREKDFYPGKPINYRIKIREGKHRRDKEVIFNMDEGKAIYRDYLKKDNHEVKLPSDVLDPLSAFFYIRFFELIPGKSVYVTVFDSKKIWNVEVKVLKRENVKTPLGKFDTVVIKPLMKSEGIFSRKGDIIIYLTDDNKRIPVMLKTEVLIGSVIATLTGGAW